MASGDYLTVINNVVKSEEDKRLYRGLQLSNRMKVLLISDPGTDKSAAALDVHVGHMCDPKELPGLAHFCEHMLFLGTEKYPSENEYNKFLSEHGGRSNAFTAADHTNYFFEVTPQHLHGALDRFAQFFLCPLFTECSTDREVNAVNSEHEKNIQCDVWRLEQLMRSTSNPEHAYNKFGTGNKETLDIIPKSRGISTRDELLKFHKQWYSSNTMALSVLGAEPLDKLQEIIVNLFSNIADKDVTAPEWKEHPFGPDQLKRMLKIVPVKDIRKLSVTFPIPDLQPYYKTGPGHYLGHLIGHEGPGSLLSTLKTKGWANSLVGGQREGARGFSFFIVSSDLTEEGIEHVEDIVTLIFQYLRMLRDAGSQEWIFRECQHLNAMTFRFKDKERPESYACATASCLHDYPIEEVLSGPYLIEDYRPELIEMVLSKLTPDAVQVAVCGKKFENEVDIVEPWYGTRYSVTPIPNEVLEKWQNVQPNENLQLPSRNEFIPTNFDLVPREDEMACSLPLMIKDTSLARVWFKQDQAFLLPKAVLNFHFCSPLAYLDPLNWNFACMFVQLFRDALNEYAYAAELAGLAYSLSNTKYGILLSIKGYNDKQHILLTKIMEKLTTFKVDPKRFEILKERYLRNLRNFESEQPHQHATYYLSLLLTEHAWTKDELLAASNELTAEGLQAFIPELLSKLHIEALIHGNVTKQQAFELVSVVESGLQEKCQTKSLLRSQLLKDREIQIPHGSSYNMSCENNVHSSSCTEIYYQCALQETRANVLIELFCQLIREPCFNVLRTQEQLGYIVWSGVRRGNSVQGLTVTVQSDRSPKYVDGRIEAFLYSMKNYLTEISDEEFERHKEALAAIRLEKPKKLYSQTSKYWNEITSQQYNFDRDNIEVAVLRTLQKQDIIDFFQELFAHDAPKRHKLAVHIFNANSPDVTVAHGTDACLDGLAPVPKLNEPTVIEDITQFKSTMSLFPLILPYIPLSSLTVEAKSKL